MTNPALTTARVGPQHAAALAELFVRAGCSCHCQFWHFEGSNNDWLLRCAGAAHDNAAALRQQLMDSSTQLLGTVASHGAHVVGWMKLQPAQQLAKLYRGRLYRGLACFGEVPRERVYTVGCFLVDPEYRRQGVARQLLAKGIDCAREAGAHFLEAFPRTDEPASDATLWTGPPDVFRDAGFTIAHDFEPYPVLRLALH